jgi:uncharacterized phiE125 gp8 family phage protein
MSIPLTTIKSALKVDFDDDDRELTRLREAALSLLARKTRLQFEPATQTLRLSAWRDSMFPVVPYLSLSSVAYTDASGASQTMPATDYWVDLTDAVPVLRFLEQPALDDGTMIVVTYTAGYADMPPDVVHAAISLIGHWYNNPEATQPIALQTVPLGLEYLIAHLSTASPIR